MWKSRRDKFAETGSRRQTQIEEGSSKQPTQITSASLPSSSSPPLLPSSPPVLGMGLSRFSSSIMAVATMVAATATPTISTSVSLEEDGPESSAHGSLSSIASLPEKMTTTTSSSSAATGLRGFWNRSQNAMKMKVRQQKSAPGSLMKKTSKMERGQTQVLVHSESPAVFPAQKEIPVPKHVSKFKGEMEKWWFEEDEDYLIGQLPLRRCKSLEGGTNKPSEEEWERPLTPFPATGVTKLDLGPPVQQQQLQQYSYLTPPSTSRHTLRRRPTITKGLLASPQGSNRGTKHGEMMGTTTAICENCARIVKKVEGFHYRYHPHQQSFPLRRPSSSKMRPRSLPSEDAIVEASSSSKKPAAPSVNPVKRSRLACLKRKSYAIAGRKNNSAPEAYNRKSKEGAVPPGTEMTRGMSESTSLSAGKFMRNVRTKTRRLCGRCEEPVVTCLDVVLRSPKRDTTTVTPPSVEVWESEIRTARCGDVAVTHVSELDFPDADPPCHFCCEQASTAIHDESRLQIVSGGLVCSRDGSSRAGSAPYINLPSPNVQTEAGQRAFGSLDLSPSMSLSTNLLSPLGHLHIVPPQIPCPHRLSGVSLILAGPSQGGSTAGTSRGGSLQSAGGSGSFSSMATGGGHSHRHHRHSQQEKDDEGPSPEPTASALSRRTALVPPKFIADDDDEIEGEVVKDKNNVGRSCDDSFSPRNRRSSIVVIPPMQICPGDLLVYGKTLSQRKSLLGTPIGSPSPNPSGFDTDSSHSRGKGKSTWSLLKLFERGGGRSSKGVPSGTLQELMGSIQPCEFSDPKLSRFKGMMWSGFVSHVENQKTKKAGGGGGGSGLSSASASIVDLKNPATVSTSAANQSPTRIAMASTSTTTKPVVRKRMGLMRTMSDRYLERRMGSLVSAKAAASVLVEEVKEEPQLPESLPSPKKEPPSKAGLSLNLNMGESAVEKQQESEEEKKKLRQKEALWDLFQSECSFLYDHLMVLKNVFMEPLKRIQVEGFAMYAEPDILFGNLDELCAVTYAFCKEFINLLLTLTAPSGELATTKVLAKVFEPSSKARCLSQAYHRYALNYINALNYLDTLRRHVEFCEFEKLCMKDPRCKKLQLTDLLVSPVQHIMKVPLILKDIQARTDEVPEKEIIAQILEIQEGSIRELDDKMKWLKNFERLLEIQRNIIWPSILEMEPKVWVPEFLRMALGRQPCDSIVVSPRRQIIHEGLLQLWDTGKPSECYVILFDDMLLITRRKKGLSKKKSSITENWRQQAGAGGGGSSEGAPNHRYIVYRQPISLDRFFIHDIAEGEQTIGKMDHAFVLVSLNRFQQIIAVHTFQAPQEGIKNTWLLKLKMTQDNWKRTLQTTVFRGVRSSTDSGNPNMSSSILALDASRHFLNRSNTLDSSN